ncbi:MAG: cobalt transporter CbiM [Rhodospirillaceae bacterium]|nr:cobalt transporter CbiM [Rhodospirillaceae bacterium]
MHIADGVVAVPVIATTSAIAVAGLGLGLRSIDDTRVPQVAVLSATFFVASLVHINLGPSSVHLILNGLIGVLLGWAAFPAMFVGLLLQSVLFGFGGITVLGLNLFNIAVPAVICGVAAREVIATSRPAVAAAVGGVAGAAAIAMTAMCVAIALALSGQEFLPAAEIVVLAHMPVMAIEGLITAAAVVLIKRVRPDMFPSRRTVAPL